MNTSVSHSARADEARQAIQHAATFGECATLAKKHHRTTSGHALDFVESYFLLGATVARAHVVAPWGSDPLGRLVRETGIARTTLYYAQRFYYTFGGDFESMNAWAASWIARYDRVLLKDVRELVSRNKDRQRLARLVEAHNAARRGRALSEYLEGQLQEAGLPDPGESTSDLSFKSVDVPPLSAEAAHPSTTSASPLATKDGEEKRRLRLQRRLGDAVLRMVRDEVPVFIVRKATLPSGRVVALRIEIVER